MRYKLYFGILVLLFPLFTIHILRYAKTASNSSNSAVLLIIDDKFANALSSELNTFEQDIRQDLQVNVLRYMVNTKSTSPLQIRNYIKSLYQSTGVQGAILIGDIPAIYVGSNQTPSDMF